jgi:hypothetical protein
VDDKEITRLAETPAEARLVEAAVASSLGDRVLPDQQEVWLARFRDRTLLVLAVVAHAHGVSEKEIRRATGQWPGAVRLSLRNLRKADLVERERRPGSDHWFATAEGTQLGVVPYVTRLLGAIKPLYSGWWGDWSVGRFRDLGTTHGPPIFSPAYTLDDPQTLAEAIRTGSHEERLYALTKLVALKDPAGVGTLVEVAGRRGKEELLARQAVVALGSFDTPASIEALMEIAARRGLDLARGGGELLGSAAGRRRHSNPMRTDRLSHRPGACGGDSRAGANRRSHRRVIHRACAGGPRQGCSPVRTRRAHPLRRCCVAHAQPEQAVAAASPRCGDGTISSPLKP